MGQRASGCHIKVDALAPNVARIHQSGHPDIAAKSKKSDMETGLTNHHRPLMPTFSSFYFFVCLFLFYFPTEFDIDSGRDPIVSGYTGYIGLRYINICIRIRFTLITKHNTRITIDCLFYSASETEKKEVRPLRGESWGRTLAKVAAPKIFQAGGKKDINSRYLRLFYRNAGTGYLSMLWKETCQFVFGGKLRGSDGPRKVVY